MFRRLKDLLGCTKTILYPLAKPIGIKMERLLKEEQGGLLVCIAVATYQAVQRRSASTDFHPLGEAVSVLSGVVDVDP